MQVHILEIGTRRAPWPDSPPGQKGHSPTSTRILAERGSGRANSVGGETEGMTAPQLARLTGHRWTPALKSKSIVTSSALTPLFSGIECVVGHTSGLTPS